MKKLFSIFSFMCLPLLAAAQFGIKGGLNASYADVKDSKSLWTKDGISTGIHAGVFGRLNILGIYLQPEVYYTFSQASIKKGDIDVERLDVNFHRLDVPLLLGIKLNDHLSIQAGPFASLNIKTSAGNNSNDWEEQLDAYYETAVYGWQAGVSLDFWRLFLSARYEATIGNLREFEPEDFTWNQYLPEDWKQQQLVFSLGYQLKKNK